MADKLETNEKNSAVQSQAREKDYVFDQVFANPAEYLKVLQNNMKQFDKNNSGGVDEKELKEAAATAPSLQARSAAELTLKHYDDLSSASRFPKAFDDKTWKEISDVNVQYAIDALGHSNSKTYSDHLRNYYERQTKIDAAVGVGFAVLAGVEAYGGAYPWAGANAGLSAARFWAVKTDMDKAKNAEQIVQDRFVETQKSLTGWAEFK